MPKKKISLEFEGDMDQYADIKRDTAVGTVMENLPEERRREKLITFEKWYPILQRFGDPDDMTVDEMLSRATPLSVAKLVELMISAKSEKIQAQCAKEIAYMGGLKPVEKTQSVNVNVMARSEATSLLQSKLEQYGIEIIDGEIVEEEGQNAEEENGQGCDSESGESQEEKEDSEPTGKD
jgi:hypothetical protein